jgi:hypothetical protein
MKTTMLRRLKIITNESLISFAGVSLAGIALLFSPTIALASDITNSYATSTSYATISVNVVSGDLVNAWGSISKYGEQGGSSCVTSTGNGNRVEGGLFLNQGATSTIDAAGAIQGNSQGNMGCSVSFIGTYTATSTKTITFTTQTQNGYGADLVSLLVQKISVSSTTTATSSSSSPSSGTVDNPILDLFLGILIFMLTAYGVIWFFKRN